MDGCNGMVQVVVVSCELLSSQDFLGRNTKSVRYQEARSQVRTRKEEEAEVVVIVVRKKRDKRKEL